MFWIEEQDGLRTFREGKDLPEGAQEMDFETWHAAMNAARQASAPPAMPVRLSFLEFIDLFTEDEQLAIAGAAMTDAPTKLWYDRAVGAQFIDLTDQRLATGLQALVDAKLLTSARRSRVLNGLAPEG